MFLNSNEVFLYKFFEFYLFLTLSMKFDFEELVSLEVGFYFEGIWNMVFWFVNKGREMGFWGIRKVGKRVFG